MIRERKTAEYWRRGILSFTIEKVIHSNVGLICRATNLPEHGIKVFERVLESKIKEQVKIDDMQFGFTHGKSTTDANFRS